jgi:hypothetical protein
MAASQPNVPPDVLVALEDCIKAAERFGYGCATHTKTPAALFQAVQESRRKVVQMVEAHSTRMYECGIEMGLAWPQSEGRKMNHEGDEL